MFGNMGCRDVFIEDDWLVVTGTMEFYMTFQSVGNGISSQLLLTP